MDINQLITPEVKGALSAVLVFAAGNILKGVTAGRTSFLIGQAIKLLGFLASAANGTKETLQKVQDR